MKYIELLGKSRDDLVGMVSELKMEYMNLRFSSKVSQTVRVGSFKRCRRDIARVLTRLSQLNSSEGKKVGGKHAS
jgi:ribosomal protein L29